MDWVSVVVLIVSAAAIAGVFTAWRTLRAVWRAEEAWVRAAAAAEVHALLADLVAEDRTLSRKDSVRESVRKAYLEDSLADLIRSLSDRRVLHTADSRLIESALRQPSLAGRRGYAEKLVEEGLKGRVKIG